MKVVRIVLMIKQVFREVKRNVQPRRVNTLRFEGNPVDSRILHSVALFFATHLGLVIIGMLLVSLCGQYDFESNLTAVITCICNVGPGLAHLGPTENFSGYVPFAKYVLMFLMLAGRLEIFPMLALFSRYTWKKAN
jgi:trk system potassium uptake protein TrkH